jgi:hypothetical protein
MMVQYRLAKESIHYLLIKMLHSNTTRSPDKTTFSMSLATAAKFFFLSSKLKGCAFSLTTCPVGLGMYSLHSSTDLTRTMLCIRNSSKDVTACPGFVIIFKQKSTAARSTVWWMKEYGCLPCKVTRTFINLVHALFVKPHSLPCLSLKESSVK